MAVFTDSQVTSSSNSKQLLTKTFPIARTDISTTTVKAILPGSATVLFAGVANATATASNAGTTATITVAARRVGAASTTVLQSDVKTAAAPTTPGLNAVGAGSADVGINPTTMLKDIEILAYYGETGTASSAGGPWGVTVAYVI